jgi:hypothetical protein
MTISCPAVIDSAYCSINASLFAFRNPFATHSENTDRNALLLQAINDMTSRRKFCKLVEFCFRFHLCRDDAVLANVWRFYCASVSLEASFNIAHEGRVVMKMTLAKSHFRIGEEVVLWFETSQGHLPCYQVCALDGIPS